MNRYERRAAAARNRQIVVVSPNDEVIVDQDFPPPDDGRFYFPATPPSPGKARTVVWTKGMNVALPHADYVALYELNDDKTKIRSWGTVPFNALLEQSDGHVMGVSKGRFYLHHEAWPTMEWVEAHQTEVKP